MSFAEATTGSWIGLSHSEVARVRAVQLVMVAWSM